MPNILRQAAMQYVESIHTSQEGVESIDAVVSDDSTIELYIVFRSGLVKYEEVSSAFLISWAINIQEEEN